MTYTLADAVRDRFKRTHPRGKNTLKCTSCYRRKDREDFREQPWHGRAARCMHCEGDQWWERHNARAYWELEQAREKLRAYQRYAAHLKYSHYRRRYVMAWGQTEQIRPEPMIQTTATRTGTN